MNQCSFLLVSIDRPSLVQIMSVNDIADAFVRIWVA